MSSKPKKAKEKRKINNNNMINLFSSVRQIKNYHSTSPRRKLENNDLNDYIFLSTLGRGTFSEVKLAIHKLTQKKVAIKILNKEKIRNENDIERIIREIHLLSVLKHPNIVQLYDTVTTNDQIYIIMEYIEGHDLATYINEVEKIPEKKASELFRQLISCLEYIHTLGIVHRDIKPENILLTRKKKLIKLIDFGLSNSYRFGEMLNTACGSPCFASPEMISGNKYNGFATDLWSCGVVLFYMLVGKLPFDEDNLKVLYTNIKNAKFIIPDNLSPDAQDLISKILISNPTNRIKLSEIKAHPFFKLGDDIPLYKGILIGIDNISVDKNIIQKMLRLYYNDNNLITEKFLISEIQKNNHNCFTTVYYLLLKDAQENLNTLEISNLENKNKNINLDLFEILTNLDYDKKNFNKNNNLSLDTNLEINKNNKKTKIIKNIHLKENQKNEKIENHQDKKNSKKKYNPKYEINKTNYKIVESNLKNKKKTIYDLNISTNVNERPYSNPRSINQRDENSKKKIIKNPVKNNLFQNKKLIKRVNVHRVNGNINIEDKNNINNIKSIQTNKDLIKKRQIGNIIQKFNKLQKDKINTTKDKSKHKTNSIENNNNNINNKNLYGGHKGLEKFLRRNYKKDNLNINTDSNIQKKSRNERFNTFSNNSKIEKNLTMNDNNKSNKLTKNKKIIINLKADTATSRKVFTMKDQYLKCRPINTKKYTNKSHTNKIEESEESNNNHKIVNNLTFTQKTINQKSKKKIKNSRNYIDKNNDLFSFNTVRQKINSISIIKLKDKTNKQTKK